MTRGKIRLISDRVTRLVASPASIALHATALAFTWLLEPHFGWSATYNLIVSNSISDETLMVGLFILSASIRDSQVLHAKEDDLLRATPGTHKELIGMESRPEEELPSIS